MLFDSPMLGTPCLRALFLAAACALSACGTAPEPKEGRDVQWHAWSADVFARARAEQRLVLLDLGTGWCHWCHVMEETTYANGAVRAELAAHYVAVAADADARLDLAGRYQDYGWPATIVFDGNGRELSKHRGYIAPDAMLALLQRLAADPQPLEEGASLVATAAAPNDLPDAVRDALIAREEWLYDDALGGFGKVQKYLAADGAERLLVAARAGDARAAVRLRQTLAAERKLIDPVWGGAYQYSHGGDWEHPHFEKIMSRQLADLRAYALAYGAFGDAGDLDAARSVHRYLRDFLRDPSGAFRASQDADVVRGEHAGEYFARDDAGRRAAGMPRIDPNLYARENGQAIQGLCALYAAAGDAAALADATAAAEWVLAHRRRGDGCFAHGDADAGGPFLADSLEMARALLALWETTQRGEWLAAARATIAAIEARFAPAHPGTGFASAVSDGVLPAVTDRTENIALARAANLVFHASGDAAARRVAAEAARFFRRADIAQQPGLPSDLLLAERELREEPQHVVIVGALDDPAALALFGQALRSADPYRRIDVVASGASGARGDIELPPCDRPTAFVCSGGTCSPPVTDELDLVGLLLR